MIPVRADAMVMLEYTENAGENTVAVYEPAAVGSGIAEKDEDMRSGELVLQQGRLLRPQDIGVLAALGINSVPVFGSLTLALFSTGDELIHPCEIPQPGMVRDINSLSLCVLAESRGFSVVMRNIIPDDETLLEDAVRKALELADIVVVSGGSSRGEKDFTEKVFSRIASPGVFTQGLAIKPGKPTILGFDHTSQTLLCGLPGHPAAAILVFEMLLSYLYRRLSHQPEPPVIQAILESDLAAAPGKVTCQPVILSHETYGYRAQPIFGKSGAISILTRADGYIIIDLNKEGLKKGETVFVHSL